MGFVNLLAKKSASTCQLKSFKPQSQVLYSIHTHTVADECKVIQMQQVQFHSKIVNEAFRNVQMVLLMINPTANNLKDGY